MIDASCFIDAVSLSIVWVLSSFKFSRWAPKDACFAVGYRMRNGVHGHPRSLISAPIESAYATSY